MPVIRALIVGLGLMGGILPAAQAADGTLGGTVSEAGSGARLEGVSVQAFCWQVVGSDPGVVCGATQTAIDGTYSLALAAGTYKVFFDHWPAHRAQFYGGGTNVSDESSWRVIVSGGEPTTGINAALLPLRPVTGTVTGNGQPVGGINVTAHQLSSETASWEPGQGTETGPDGAYALYLPDGTYRVGFSDAHGPYRTVFFDGKNDVGQADDIVVAGEGVANIDADMALNHPIRGTVTVDGVNMPGVTVTAYQQTSTVWEAGKYTMTGPDGTYALYLPDGTYRVGFRTWQGRFDPVWYDGASSLDTATDVIVAGAEVPYINAVIVSDVVESGPAITGTVTLAAGGGAPEGGVLAMALRWDAANSYWSQVRWTFVQPDGTYALYVPEGTYRVGFSHSSSRYRTVFYDGADTVDGADDVIVTSEGAPNIDAQLVDNHRITGTVTADPVPDLPPGPPPTMVRAFRWNDLYWDVVSQASSAPDGSYVLYVPDGTYRVAFEPSGPFQRLYYDGAETLDEADDVAVSGGDTPNIDAHLRGIGPAETWPPTANLSSRGQDAWGPQVAVGPDGAVTAVWYRWDGGVCWNTRSCSNRVEATTRAKDGSWSAPVALSEAGDNAWDPQVAMGAHGTAVVAWRRWDGTHFRVQAISRAVSGSWSAPEDLSSPGEDAWDPQVAMGPHGMAVVVWRSSDGTGHEVQATARRAYEPWSSPVTLSTAGEDAWDPQVAVGSGGTAIAVWSRSDGTHFQVQATIRAANGSWSSPASLSQAGGDAWDPQVAVASDGAGTVVWQRSDGSTDQIQASSRAAKGVWSTPERLSTVSKDVHDPQVAVDPDGMVTVVWGWWDSSGRVQAASRAPGGAWSRPATLSEYPAEAPQVAAGPDGKATVVWRGGWIGEQVVAATRKPDGLWSAEATLAEGAHAYGPQVAAGSDGTVAAVWELRDGYQDLVQGVARVPVPDSGGAATVTNGSEVPR